MGLKQWKALVFHTLLFFQQLYRIIQSSKCVNFHKSRVWLNFRFSRIPSFTRHIITPSNLRGWRWHLRVRSNQYLVTIILVIEEDMSTSLAPPPRLIISSYDRSKRFNFSSTSKISTDSDNICIVTLTSMPFGIFSQIVRGKGDYESENSFIFRLKLTSLFLVWNLG